MAIRGLDGPATTALVISECQNGMTNPEMATNKPLAEQVASRRMIENIAELAAALRPLGVPVFHVTVAAAADYRGWNANCLLAGVFQKRPLVEGHPSVEIHPALTPHPEDFVVRRRRGLTSFHGTELEYLLRNLGVTTVLMAGVSTNVAVLGSSIEAVNRGFRVVLPEDCVSGATEETHRFLIENIYPLLTTVTSSTEVIAELRSAAAAA